MTATRMGLIGSSDSGHHRSAKVAVVSARADDCGTITPAMPRRTAATRRHWARAGVTTRNGARLPPLPTDQNPPCKNNDIWTHPTDNRSVKGEPGPESGNQQGLRKISLGCAILATR